MGHVLKTAAIAAGTVAVLIMLGWVAPGAGAPDFLKPKPAK